MLITAIELGTEFTVSVNNGEMTLTGSVMDYCSAVFNKSGQTIAAKNAMAALYEYYTAAVAYAATQQ